MDGESAVERRRRSLYDQVRRQEEERKREEGLQITNRIRFRTRRARGTLPTWVMGWTPPPDPRSMRVTDQIRQARARLNHHTWETGPDGVSFPFRDQEGDRG